MNKFLAKETFHKKLTIGISRNNNKRKQVKLSLRAITKKRDKITILLNDIVNNQIKTLSETSCATEISLLRANRVIQKLSTIENILNDEFDFNEANLDHMNVSSIQSHKMHQVNALSKETTKLLNMAFLNESLETNNGLSESEILNNALIEDKTVD